MKLYGIWCLDLGYVKSRDRFNGAWMRERLGGNAILAFQSKREACRRAAKFYGFTTYTQAKRKGWVEVRLLAGRFEPKTTERRKLAWKLKEQ